MSKSKDNAAPESGVMHYTVRVQISSSAGAVDHVVYIPFEYDVDSIGYARTMAQFMDYAVELRKRVPYRDFIDAMRLYLKGAIFPGEV